MSENLESLRLLYPESEWLAHFSARARVVVSEPLVDLPELWREVPPSTALTIGHTLEEEPFHLRLPV